jgi:RNA polymerase sigma factor (sigma-70 family)
LVDTPRAADLAGATLANDSELVVRARQGDRRAFGTLYLRHHDAAWRVACTSASSATDAEDAVAEGFAKVFAALPRMVDRDLAFRPYLLACVRNAAIDRHRRERKIDLHDEVPDQIGGVSEPGELVLADLERNLVGEALRSLPERWRTVLWLTEVEGMTPSEVSSIIGIKPNAVAALSYRAREGLREAYLQAHIKAEARAECRFAVDRLGPYVRGELAERDRVRVQAHLDGCTTCRQRRDELADVNASLLGSLVPVPLLLGSRTQQEWLSVAHLGKGARKARPPAKAAKAASLETSSGIQTAMAGIVALLLALSSGVAVQRFGASRPVGKDAGPVAIPKTTPTPAPVPPAPASPPEVPTELAAPPVAATPAPSTPAPAAPAPTPRADRAAPPSTPPRSPQPRPTPTPAESAGQPAPAPPPTPSEPPPPPPAPEPVFFAAASVGEGAQGAVVAATVPSGNLQPQLDITAGERPLVGDAPPSKGTSLDFGGSAVPAPFSQVATLPVLTLEAPALTTALPIDVPSADGAFTATAGGPQVQPQVEIMPIGTGKALASIVPAFGSGT